MQTIAELSAIDAWQARPDVPALAGTSVHVWRAHLAADDDVVARAGAVLSADETARVALLHGPQRKNRQALSFGLLRVLLARYLHAQPKEIRFGKSPTGKPILLGAASASLRFSVSHSDEMALYAFAAHAEVGVDIERRRPLQDFEGMLETALTPAERAIVRTLPAAAMERVFFEAWTIKEACLKATGEGIAGLDKVEAILGLQDGEPVLGCRGGSLAAREPWTVRRLQPGTGYAAAAVVTGPCAQMCQFVVEPAEWLA